MPNYLYECKPCSSTICYIAKFGQAPKHVYCDRCGRVAMRVFSVPHLITQPHFLRDENRSHLSAKEKLEERKKDDVLYYEHAAGYQGVACEPLSEPEAPTLYELRDAGYDMPTIADLKREGVI